MKNKCPVCGHQSNTTFLIAKATHGSKVLGSKLRFKYLKCGNCNSIFLVDIQIDKKYYRQNYEFSGYHSDRRGIRVIVENFLSNNTFRTRQKLISSFFNKEKISILDVGCGEGKFLTYLDDDKFEKTGVELNKPEYILSRKKKLEVYNGDILNIDFQGRKFDVVTLWHVIEHIPNPNALLYKISSVLSTNGIVVFATPNNASLGLKLGGDQWFHLDAPRHLVLYNNKGISILLCKY